MSKILCKYDYIDEHITDDLEKISAMLNEIVGLGDRIVVPNDFAYSRSLKTKFNEIDKIYKSFSKDKNKLLLASKKSKDSIKEVDELIGDLLYEKFDMEVRHNIIF